MSYTLLYFVLCVDNNNLNYFLQDAKEINNDEVVKYLTRRIIDRVLLGLHKKDKYIIVLHLLKQVYEHLVPDKVRVQLEDIENLQYYFI